MVQCHLYSCVTTNKVQHNVTYILTKKNKELDVRDHYAYVNVNVPRIKLDLTNCNFAYQKWLSSQNYVNTKCQLVSTYPNNLIKRNKAREWRHLTTSVKLNLNGNNL